MKSDGEIIQLLKKMFYGYFNAEAKIIKPLPQAGSPRKYFRMQNDLNSAIGSYNADVQENEAFFYIAKQMKKSGIHVPEIYIINEDRNFYLQEDLGDITVYNKLKELAGSKEQTFSLYKKVIEQLVRIHFEASPNMDYTICYPREKFDRQSILWDLYYFKYMYLKIAQISFNEQKLENDFQNLTDHLLEAPAHFFLYRDFKSKNIMLKNDKLYFIDFQGGREGANQYDLASLLYEGKQNISQEFRNQLLQHYCDTATKYPSFTESAFLKYYPAYVLIRLLQVFGAYGYRGLIEKKSHFIESIPGGLKNIASLLNNYDLQCDVPYLMDVLQRMLSQEIDIETKSVSDGLTVDVYSFSYKKGIPEDYSGNGGGFVFDCRCIPNPGRQEKFKTMTGQDAEVAEYIASIPEAENFKSSVTSLVDIAVNNYLSRSFDHLQISFGCTGGQHRSVFMAEKISEYLSKTYALRVKVKHRELNVSKINGKNNV